MDGFSEFLSNNGRPLARKHINFRRDTISFNDYNTVEGDVEAEYRVLTFHRRRSLFIPRQEAQDYLTHLQEMSIDLTYADVFTVVSEYQEVLRRPRLRGMRAQRNFSGKIEDEIRGKLAEQGLANFCEQFGVHFEPFYELLPPGERRDAGDFLTCLLEGNEDVIDIPDNMKIAVKSTNGYFCIALPENEWDWPGGIYIGVRPHLQADFMLRLINRAFEIEDIALDGNIGWLEIEGWISKEDIERYSYIGKRLPGKYHSLREDFRLDNYIMHPLQLHRTRDEFEDLMRRYHALNEDI